MTKVNNPSSRHHYIPEFYIKGFCNPSGFLYIYDKKTGKILNDARPPKSILFEYGRNTFTRNGEDSSALEDKFYSKLDSVFAKTIIPLRTLPNDKSILTQARIIEMHYFIVNLFWRIPFSDQAFNHVFDQMFMIDKIKQAGVSYTDLETVKKIKKASLAAESFRTWIDSRPTGGAKAMLFDKLNPHFLISDNPIVFKDEPRTVEEVITNDFFLAISSNRIYCNLKEGELEFDQNQAFAYNMIQIFQAKNYVCSPDLNLLKEYINSYKSLSKSEQSFLLSMKNRLFKK